MKDKLNLPNRKVGSEEERGFLSRYLRSVVVHKDRHPGVEHQLQALLVVGDETQPEMVLLKKRGLALRTKFSNNFVVGYTKSKLLWRPKGLVYVL